MLPVYDASDKRRVVLTFMGNTKGADQEAPFPLLSANGVLLVKPSLSFDVHKSPDA